MAERLGGGVRSLASNGTCIAWRDLYELLPAAAFRPKSMTPDGGPQRIRDAAALNRTSRCLELIA